MFTKKLWLALVEDPGDFANKLHNYYIYEVSLAEQIKTKELIKILIKNYSDDNLRKLAFDERTNELMEILISTKSESNWNKIILRFLKGLSHQLEREINNSEKIEKPQELKNLLLKKLQTINLYGKNDIIKIEEPKENIVKINYTNLKNSPEYDGKHKTWRDTQFKFTLFFSKGLFVWDYINVHKSLRSKGLGTEIVFFCEQIAKEFGFKRFSVELPNRKYWVKKINYNIPRIYKIGSVKNKMHYTHEGYKELEKFE